MGNNGSKPCENGKVIKDKDLCQEVCEKFKVPIKTPLIHESNCYINWEGNCYQKDNNGDGASLICRKLNDSKGNE